MRANVWYISGVVLGLLTDMSNEGGGNAKSDRKFCPNLAAFINQDGVKSRRECLLKKWVELGVSVRYASEV